MTKSKKIMIGALPFAALIVLFAVFCGIVSSKGYRLDMYIKIIFNEGGLPHEVLHAFSGAPTYYNHIPNEKS